jgi:soluble lytic murein transglycosylase
MDTMAFPDPNRRFVPAPDPSVTGAGLARALYSLMLAAAAVLVPAPAAAQAGGTARPVLVSAPATAPVGASAAADAVIVAAREAHRKGERARLASLRASALAAGHPLAPWVDYWELNNRLYQAGSVEVEAFFARWPGSYVEDRLRNDWLLELGRRRDWAGFAREHPKFRMNDDREVTCYALYLRHQAGEDVSAAAREHWYAQREADDGCLWLARTLFEARQFGAADVWQEVRLSAEFNRPRAARAAAALLGADVARAVEQVFDNPARWLAHRAGGNGPHDRQLRVAAILRVAANDPDAAATQLGQPGAKVLPPELKSAAWAVVAKQAAMKLQPEAATWFRRAFELQRAASDARESAPWSDDSLAWAVRAALRLAREDERWVMVQDAIEAMSAAERAKDPAWAYWHARALTGRAVAGPQGDAARAAGRAALQAMASPFTFYGKLALEDLGGRVSLPASPPALTVADREAASAHPGLRRGLQMIALGLRPEGVREWNFSLIGMSDRELRAAAQLACDREVWDRCINASDRTKSEVDLAQRFPTPFRQDVLSAARQIGLDPAYVYGLIRQESRFIMDARSHVGASGLMQIMPATARWTARKIGLDFKPEMITDRDVNLKLGTAYLKLVLDDFGGSAAMAAAAYNAGPSRPRRWRDGPLMEVAAWAEGIPFHETRDYVKKVLSNATIYAALLEGANTLALKPRLGGPIGPRDASAPTPNQELP